MTYFYTHRLVHSLTREGAFYSSLVWRLTTGQAVEKERLDTLFSQGSEIKAQEGVQIL